MKSLLRVLLAVVWFAAGEVLAATEAPATAVRPQTPQPPFPYIERKLVFDGTSQGVNLAAR